MESTNEQKRTIRQLYRKGFTSVRMRELQGLWAELAKQRILYNGMTHCELLKRYGHGNLVHVYARRRAGGTEFCPM